MSKREGFLLTVDKERAGQRIDNFLLRELKGVPRSHIYKILRSGEVRVNKGRIKAEYKVVEGDIIRIPPIRLSVKELPEGNFIWLEECILYEDDAMIVLNKPSGLAVHGGSEVSLGAIEALRKLRPKQKYLELVHRLDKDTSGCLLIAKKASMLRLLHEKLRKNEVTKIYLALLKGRLKKQKLVDVPIKKNILAGGERIVTVNSSGKESQTIFVPIKVFANATLVQVKLLTGRTHQIRVHSAHIGHPIAGDAKYGDKIFNQEIVQYGLHRLFLQAHKLNFKLDTGKEYSFEAPLDKALQEVVQRLEATIKFNNNEDSDE